MVLALLTFSGIAECVFLLKTFRARRLSVSHEVLFVAGHCYYILLPLFFAYFRILNNKYSAVYDLWDALAEKQVLLVLLAITLTPAFLAGSQLGKKRVKTRHHPNQRKGLTILFAPYVFLIALAVPLIYFGQSRLFGAYENLNRKKIEGDSFRAFLSGLAVLGTVSALCCFDSLFFSKINRNYSTTFRRFVKIFTPLGLILWLPLLASGGRSYVITSIFIVLIYWSNYVRTFSVKRSTVLLLFGVISIATMGSLRVGETPTVGRLVYYASTEPVLTATSMFGSIKDGTGAEFVPFRLPVYLLSDFVNLIPRVVLSNKDSYRRTPESDGYSVINPLGAFALELSLLVNFGWIGGFLAVFLFGAALSKARLRSLNCKEPVRQQFWRVSYAASSAWIPFSLFRDTFGISLIRGILGFGIAMPYLLLKSASTLQSTGPRQVFNSKIISVNESQ
jgi:hypothetical protein